VSKLGDGYFYDPMKPKEPKPSKHVEEMEKIFEEALKGLREKEGRGSSQEDCSRR